LSEGGGKSSGEGMKGVAWPERPIAPTPTPARWMTRPRCRSRRPRQQEDGGRHPEANQTLPAGAADASGDAMETEQTQNARRDIQQWVGLGKLIEAREKGIGEVDGVA
jgi:hypothetical protein